MSQKNVIKMSPPVNVCIIVQRGNYAWVSCFETIQEVLADLACKQISVPSTIADARHQEENPMHKNV